MGIFLSFPLILTLLVTLLHDYGNLNCIDLQYYGKTYVDDLIVLIFKCHIIMEIYDIMNYFLLLTIYSLGVDVLSCPVTSS